MDVRSSTLAAARNRTRIETASRRRNAATVSPPIAFPFIKNNDNNNNNATNFKARRITTLRAGGHYNWTLWWIQREAPYRPLLVSVSRIFPYRRHIHVFTVCICDIYDDGQI